MPSVESTSRKLSRFDPYSRLRRTIDSVLPKNGTSTPDSSTPSRGSSGTRAPISDYLRLRRPRRSHMPVDSPTAEQGDFKKSLRSMLRRIADSVADEYEASAKYARSRKHARRDQVIAQASQNSTEIEEKKQATQPIFLLERTLKNVTNLPNTMPQDEPEDDDEQAPPYCLTGLESSLSELHIDIGEAFTKSLELERLNIPSLIDVDSDSGCIHEVNSNKVGEGLLLSTDAEFQDVNHFIHPSLESRKRPALLPHTEEHVVIPDTILTSLLPKNPLADRYWKRKASRSHRVDSEVSASEGTRARRGSRFAPYRSNGARAKTVRFEEDST